MNRFLAATFLLLPTVVASDVIAVFKSGDGGDCVIMYRTPRLLVVRCACFLGK